MLKYIGAILVWLLMVTIWAMAGCQTSGFQEGDFTGQGLTATFSQPATPDVVIATHEDGSQTVVPVVVGAPVKTPASASPVIRTEVIRGQPGVVSSYTVTPETQKKGDGVVSSRCMTWAGDAPGTVSMTVATQKKKIGHPSLPAVTIDATGVHAGPGGWSTEDQAGQSYWQRFTTWTSNLFKSWTMALLVIGLLIGAFFILPMIFPVLAPIFGAIFDGIHRAWDWVGSKISDLFAWLKTWHTK